MFATTEAKVYVAIRLPYRAGSGRAQTTRPVQLADKPLNPEILAES